MSAPETSSVWKKWRYLDVGQRIRRLWPPPRLRNATDMHLATCCKPGWCFCAPQRSKASYSKKLPLKAASPQYYPQAINRMLGVRFPRRRFRGTTQHVFMISSAPLNVIPRRPGQRSQSECAVPGTFGFLAKGPMGPGFAVFGGCGRVVLRAPPSRRTSCVQTRLRDAPGRMASLRSARRCSASLGSNRGPHLSPDTPTPFCVSW